MIKNVRPLWEMKSPLHVIVVKAYMARSIAFRITVILSKRSKI
jgi:hypothetical protein